MRIKEKGNKYEWPDLETTVRKLKDEYIYNQLYYLDYCSKCGEKLNFDGTYKRTLCIPIDYGVYDLIDFNMQILIFSETKKTIDFQGGIFLKRLKYIVPDIVRMLCDYVVPDKEESPSQKLKRFGISKKTMLQWKEKLKPEYERYIANAPCTQDSLMTPEKIVNTCDSFITQIELTSQMWRSSLPKVL